MSRRMFAGLALVGLALMVVLPAASAAPGGTERPFTATFVGQASWEFPGDHPAGCQVVTTVTEASGRATHLGATTLSSSHCPAEPALLLDGRVTLVAANGDQVFGVYDYDPFDEGTVILLEIVGGTGRFEGASGEVVWTYAVVPELIEGCDDPSNFECLDLGVPWQWSSTMDGFISY